MEVNYIAGTPYVGANVKTYADPVDPGDGSRGAFTAWDPVAKKPVWRIKEKFPVWCGAAGDGRRCGLLRHDGRLVQGRRRRARGRSSGSSRPAPGSSASRSPTAAPTASSTWRSSRASAGGPGWSSRRARPPRPDRRDRVRRGHEGPAAAHDEGRHALRLLPPLSSGSRRPCRLVRSPRRRRALALDGAGAAR